MNIGKSVVIKGELNGSEDLTIEGHVEGKIELRQNVLTIGPNGKIKAQVFAKAVIILGEVTGNVTASEKVDIRDNGSVDGDIASPRVAIAEGAHFRGSIDMQRSGGAQAGKRRARASLPGSRQPGAARPSGPQSAAGSRRRQPLAEPLRRSRAAEVSAFHGRTCSPGSPLAPDSAIRLPTFSAAAARSGSARPRRRRACAEGSGASSSVQGAAEIHRRALAATEAPVLLDFGPVIGSNVAFFGEQLGCKIFIEDLAAELDKHIARRHARMSCPTALGQALPAGRASVDGILCWDIFDFLEQAGGDGAGARRSSACSSPAAP